MTARPWPADQRRWDFSMLDDEVCDHPTLTPQARAAYWSIVRHARMAGETSDPSEVLMRGAGIRKRPTYRRARAELASLGFIAVHPRPRRPPRIVILPVQKRRDGPKTAPYRQGVVPTSGPSVGPKTDHDSGRKGPMPISLISDTGKKRGSRPLTPEQEEGARRFAVRYKKATGKDLVP